MPSGEFFKTCSKERPNMITSTICGVTPRILSDDEKSALADIMDKSTPIIKEAASRHDLSVKSFRIKFFKGELEVTEEERQAVNAVKNIELTMLEGYCRVAYVVARKFYRKDLELKSGVVLDDYLQEAMAAISDSIFCYNKVNQFSTYVVWSIRNRLILYIQNDQSLSPVKKRILKLRAKILKHMNTTGKSFDESADDLEVNSKDREECSASCAKTVDTSEVNWDYMLSPYEHVSMNVDSKAVMEAFEKAPLSDFERDILTAYINDVPFVRITDNYNYSRMAGNYALKRALEIVGNCFDKTDFKVEKAA